MSYLSLNTTQLWTKHSMRYQVGNPNSKVRFKAAIKKKQHTRTKIIFPDDTSRGKATHTLLKWLQSCKLCVKRHLFRFHKKKIHFCNCLSQVCRIFYWLLQWGLFVLPKHAFTHTEVSPKLQTMQTGNIKPPRGSLFVSWTSLIDGKIAQNSINLNQNKHKHSVRDWVICALMQPTEYLQWCSARISCVRGLVMLHYCCFI